MEVVSPRRIPGERASRVARVVALGCWVAGATACGKADAEAVRKAAVTPHGARMIAIPGATFAFRESMTVGTTPVTVSAFQIEATEVTVAAYAACVADKACNEPVVKGRVAKYEEPTCNWGKPGREDHPINCVSSSEAEVYCQWNGGRRLPTTYEAYWAALGDGRMNEEERLDANRHRTYPWGRGGPETVEHCWKRGSFGGPKGGVVGPITTAKAPVSADLGTCPVASYAGDRSAFGLFDTSGNVAEIVFDPRPIMCFGLDGERPCPRERMFRVTGGSWFDNESIGNQSPADNHPVASDYHPWYGFRCVAGPP